MGKNDIYNFEHFGEIFVKYNKINENFHKEFIVFAPEMEADIVSARINEDCSCKFRIKEKVENDKLKYVNFLYDFFIEGDVVLDLESIKKEININSIAGRIAKTKISDWADFHRNIEKTKAVYKSFSVVKDNDELLVFFL